MQWAIKLIYLKETIKGSNITPLVAFVMRLKKDEEPNDRDKRIYKLLRQYGAKMSYVENSNEYKWILKYCKEWSKKFTIDTL